MRRQRRPRVPWQRREELLGEGERPFLYPATGEAKFSPIKPAEGSPQSFSANGFSFTDAVGPLTYQWRFQNGGCNFGTGGCMGPDPNGTIQLVPSYGAPVSGESITHSWTLAGTFLVELTAIDSRGIKGSKEFPVTVENVPPTLGVDGECILDPAGIPFFSCNPRTRTLGESARMSGSFGDVGTGTYNRLTINWGDGAVDSQCISPPDLRVCFHVIVVGQPDPLQLGRGNGSYTFDGSHTYAQRGSYYGAVTVNDPMGGSKSEPFVVTIKGLAQSINFPAMACAYLWRRGLRYLGDWRRLRPAGDVCRHGESSRLRPLQWRERWHDRVAPQGRHVHHHGKPGE